MTHNQPLSGLVGEKSEIPVFHQVWFINRVWTNKTFVSTNVPKRLCLVPLSRCNESPMEDNKTPHNIIKRRSASPKLWIKISQYHKADVMLHMAIKTDGEHGHMQWLTLIYWVSRPNQTTVSRQAETFSFQVGLWSSLNISSASLTVLLLRTFTSTRTSILTLPQF